MGPALPRLLSPAAGRAPGFLKVPFSSYPGDLRGGLVRAAWLWERLNQMPRCFSTVAREGGPGAATALVPAASLSEEEQQEHDRELQHVPPPSLPLSTDPAPCPSDPWRDEEGEGRKEEKGQACFRPSPSAQQ